MKYSTRNFDSRFGFKVRKLVSRSARSQSWRCHFKSVFSTHRNKVHCTNTLQQVIPIIFLLLYTLNLYPFPKRSLKYSHWNETNTLFTPEALFSSYDQINYVIYLVIAQSLTCWYDRDTYMVYSECLTIYLWIRPWANMRSQDRKVKAIWCHTLHGFVE